MYRVLSLRTTSTKLANRTKHCSGVLTTLILEMLVEYTSFMASAGKMSTSVMHWAQMF